MTRQWLPALLGTGFICASSAAADDFGDAVLQAIRGGTVDLSFRYRYELVDDELFEKNAYANTLKSRLGFEPSLGREWRLRVEFDDVRHLFDDAFNDTRNRKFDRPEVVDPEGTDLNQLLVGYGGFADTWLTFGRQRLTRDVQRFIGAHDWRQNEQTFDAATIEFDPEGPYRLSYAFVFGANRIYGPERGAPARRLDTTTHLVDAGLDLGRRLSLSAQIYLMDFDDVPEFSNSMLGLRAEGRTGLTDGLELSYQGQVASQQDYGSSRSNFGAEYYSVEAGLDWTDHDLGVALGYEILGGSSASGGGFRTPLGSLHRFLGWSDRFEQVSAFGTDDGLRDLYVTVSAGMLNGDFLLRYHRFESDRGGRDRGSELNAAIHWSMRDRYSLLVKYAGFFAEGFAADAAKIWLQLSADF